MSAAQRSNSRSISIAGDPIRVGEYDVENNIPAEGDLNVVVHRYIGVDVDNYGELRLTVESAERLIDTLQYAVDTLRKG